MDVAAENRKRDLYLLQPGGNVVMIPRGWCDDFEPDPWDEGPEIYCWGPTMVYANSPIETLWFRVFDLEHYKEITEAEARAIHPAMFAEFDRINGIAVASDAGRLFY